MLCTGSREKRRKLDSPLLVDDAIVRKTVDAVYFEDSLLFGASEPSQSTCLAERVAERYSCLRVMESTSEGIT